MDDIMYATVNSRLIKEHLIFHVPFHGRTIYTDKMEIVGIPQDELYKLANCSAFMAIGDYDRGMEPVATISSKITLSSDKVYVESDEFEYKPYYDILVYFPLTIRIKYSEYFVNPNAIQLRFRYRL